MKKELNSKEIQAIINWMSEINKQSERMVRRSNEMFKDLARVYTKRKQRN